MFQAFYSQLLLMNSSFTSVKSARLSYKHRSQRWLTRCSQSLLISFHFRLSSVHVCMCVFVTSELCMSANQLLQNTFTVTCIFYREATVQRGDPFWIHPWEVYSDGMRWMKRSDLYYAVLLWVKWNVRTGKGPDQLEEATLTDCRNELQLNFCIQSLRPQWMFGKSNTSCYNCTSHPHANPFV